MNREVHVRFWESPEVKVLRATRQSHDAIMNEANPGPAFETRQLKSAPGWYVRVAWSHGKRDLREKIGWA
jgi:hypothetical protein